jgi:hypothetical protein
MPLIISQSVLLAQAAAVDPDRPIILWDNRATSDNTTVSSEDGDFPAARLFEPVTYERWVAAAAGAVTIEFAPGNVDLFAAAGFAKHNFASAGIAVSIDADAGSGYEEILAPAIPSSDGPLLLRFTAQSAATFRINLAEGSEAAAAAVFSIGPLLEIERKVWVGHTPLPYARTVRRVNGESEAGDYTGGIVTQAFVEGELPLSLLSRAFVIEQMDPFLLACHGGALPFFMAWRPATYPAETGYCWLRNDPQPEPQPPHNLDAMTLELRGIR